MSPQKDSLFLSKGLENSQKIDLWIDVFHRKKLQNKNTKRFLGREILWKKVFLNH